MQPTREASSPSFEALEKRLKQAGFPVVGAVDYALAEPLYRKHALRYQSWIEKGSYGSMEYLKRGLERRLVPHLVFPSLKSVVVVARPYPAQPVSREGLRYARYLNGADYHETLKSDLAQVFSDETFSYKICVDTSAVLERSWAALTGIGWIGKNTLLIHPQYGSYLFLGVVLTDQEWGMAPRLHKDYCGPCTRCLNACPTAAFPEPGYLEARKCISYLTLEKRGEWEEDFDPKGFLAGCDICQEVCPYNTKPARKSEGGGIAAYLELDPQILSRESEEQYRERIAGTALSRIKYRDFRRNFSAAAPLASRKK